MLEYTQQAEKFMVGHNTKLSLLGKTLKKHFPDDIEIAGGIYAVVYTKITLILSQQMIIIMI